MTERPLPSLDDQRSDNPVSWIADGRGYWLDVVLKDFVKYSVQVTAGLYIAIFLGVVPAGDIRTRIAVVVAAILYLGSATAFAVWTWWPRATTTLGWVSTVVSILAVALLFRCAVTQVWIWATLGVAALLIGFSALARMVVLAVAASRRSRRKRAAQ